jgi:hypothetical protein
METDGITPRAIDTRISRANKVEEILKTSLDTVVMSDHLMYESLQTLKNYENPRNAPLSNTLRRYYFYKNGNEFPQLDHYRINK